MKLNLVIGLCACIVLYACEQQNSGKTVAAQTDTKSKDTDTSIEMNSPVETDTCANLDLTLERQPTTIMLVIDHSASMDLQLGDNDSRWSALVNVLMGTAAKPLAGLVWNLEDVVKFGMVLFTAKRNQPETCPMLSTVSPKLSNADAIAAILKADDETYKGASPVPEGIWAATDLLTKMDDRSKKVILLATDGAPQTCDSLARQDNETGRRQTIEAVQSAFDAGITTFVVGLGDDNTADHLQQVADAGMGLAANGEAHALYYQCLTEGSLVDAVTRIIIDESRSCVYELQGKGIAEGEEAMGTVALDGEPLELNNADYGWRLKSISEIELLGGACDDIQIGNHHLEADFPCEVIVPIIID